jgi:serine/threonine protein kinase
VQLAAGTVVSSRYEVRALLGIGGFARVYSAFDKVIERDVALKVLDLAALGASEDQIKTLMMRFEREAKLAARIDHPCVVQIHDIGRLDNAQHSPFIVMEMLSGMDLEAYLREHGSLEPGHVWELFTEALEALGEAHKIGIIHRDLKPSNLFLHMPGTRRERLRIVDFGIAAIKSKDGAGSGEDMERLTRTGQLFGTLQYMAPEYIGKQHVSPALDVYQMALILVELLCGERVVSADTPMDCLRLHTFRQMTLPEYLLRSPLRGLLKQALEPDPAYRFPDAHAFAEAMHKIDPKSIPRRSGTRRLQFLDDQDLQIEPEKEDEVDGFEDTAVAGGDSLLAAYTMEHGSSPSSVSAASQDSDADDTSIAPMPTGSPAKRAITGPFNGPTTGSGMPAPDADKTLEERGDEEADKTLEERGDEADAFADTMIAAKPPGLLRDQSPFGSPGGRIVPIPKLGGRTPLLRPGQKAIPSLDDLDGALGHTAEREPPAELASTREANSRLRPLVARIASPGVTPQFEPDPGALDDGPTVREMTFPLAADAAYSSPGPKPEGASQPAIRLMRDPLIETTRQHDPPAQRTASSASHTTSPPGPSPLAQPKTEEEVAPPNKPGAKPGVNPIVIVALAIAALAIAALAFWAGRQSQSASSNAGEKASPSAPPADTPAPVGATAPDKAPEAAPVVERRVRIDSNPQGAAILLGTRPLGKTPLDYTFREGHSQLVKVRVQLAGYAEEEVVVDASRTEPIILDLTPTSP